MTTNPERIKRAFGKTIRALRRERGIAQDRLALEAGIARGYMGELERGMHAPTLVIICRCLAALDVSAVDFAARFEHCLRHPGRVTC